MKELKGEIIRKIKAVKSIPTAAVRAIKLLQDPEANMGEVVQVISFDPGLTANILKLANSSYFGCAYKISTLREAVVRLGSANIFKLVTASVANIALSKPMRGYRLEAGQLWDHSVSVAVAAEYMAGILRTQNAPLAFTAGLLHDLGKIILDEFFTPDVVMVNKKLQAAGMTPPEIEKEVFGITHAEAGARLLSSWNIPSVLVDAVWWHHAPEKFQSTPDPSLIAMCDYLALTNNICDINAPANLKEPTKAAELLKLNETIVKEVVMRTKDSFKNIKDIFSK